VAAEPEMNWLAYLPLALLAALIVSSAVYAFFWATKNGEFRDLEGQSRSIFDASEPEGVQTDYFPGKAPRLASRASDKFQGRLRGKP
jgi:cbb3-type cytochrome oxidase maturation protein